MRALFAWVEGTAPRPDTTDPTPFRTPMLAHALEEAEDFAALAPADFSAEWKWDGIRVQAVAGVDARGPARRAAAIRAAGDDISGAFPDLLEALATGAARQRRARRRTAGRARRAGSSRSPACSSGSTARPSRPRLIADYPGPYAGLRPAGRRRRGPARRCPSPSGGRGSRPSCGAPRDPRIDLSPLVPLRATGTTWPRPARPGRGRRRRRRRRDRRPDAQAARQPLCARAARRGSGTSGSAIPTTSTP